MGSHFQTWRKIPQIFLGLTCCFSDSWDYGANYSTIDDNNSDTIGNDTDADTPFDFFITSTKAVLLGLMILITVIGKLAC